MAEYLIQFFEADNGNQPPGWDAASQYTVQANSESETGYVLRFSGTSNQSRFARWLTSLTSANEVKYVIKMRRSAGSGNDGGVFFGTFPDRWDHNFNGSEIRMRRRGNVTIANGGLLRPVASQWWIVEGSWNKTTRVCSVIGYPASGSRDDGTEISAADSQTPDTTDYFFWIDNFNYPETLYEWIAIATDGDSPPVPGGDPGITLPIDAGAYNHTGSPAELTAKRLLTMVSGKYETQGSPANLTIIAPLQPFSLQSGQYATTGSDLTLALGRPAFSFQSGTYQTQGSPLLSDIARAFRLSGSRYSTRFGASRVRLVGYSVIKPDQTDYTVIKPDQTDYTVIKPDQTDYTRLN